MGETLISISVGGEHTCGLRPDGTVACWGRQATPPVGTFVALSSGGRHTCALREDGTAACWGGGHYGQTTPPPGETFTAISSGYLHTCGLRPDGTAVCWGWNRYGQTKSPAGETFTAISSGEYHNCGLRQDGLAVCWGANHDGQTKSPAGEAFTAISSGEHHTCGLRQDGLAVCWGENEYSQSSPPGGNFVAISGGEKHTCGLREDGTAECWGNNDDGQAEPPGTAYTATPDAPPDSPANPQSDRSGSEVYVRWDGVPFADFYTVYHDISPRPACASDPSKCRSLATDVKGLQYKHENPNAHTNYYWITACNSAGCSEIDFDNPAAFPPPRPPSLAFADRTSSSLTVKWSERGSATYYLERSSSPNSGYSVLGTDLNGLSHEDGGLQPDTVYYYRMRACTLFGCSDLSEATGVLTESEGPVDVPSVPVGVVGTKIDVSGATDDARVTWDAVQGATYYKVYQEETLDAEVNSPLTSYRDYRPNSGFFGFSTTRYAVKACNKAGCSGLSATVVVR